MHTHYTNEHKPSAPLHLVESIKTPRWHFHIQVYHNMALLLRPLSQFFVQTLCTLSTPGFILGPGCQEQHTELGEYADGFI